MMDRYVARQPGQSEAEGYRYELLYRSGLTNSYGDADGTEASLTVVRNTFLFIGQWIVPQPTKAFINLTKGLLLNGVAEA